MTTSVEETARWGKEWQAAPGWESHTVARAEAERIAAGYIALLRAFGFTGKKINGLGIGSGAGHLEAAIAARGIDMVASEWNEDGVRLAKTQNPAIDCRLIDIMTFEDSDAWDLIVCRELYPFTRTNEFDQQMVLLRRLLGGLRPGGILILAGSDVSRPQCLDYPAMLRNLRRDSAVSEAYGPVLEPLLKRVQAHVVGKHGYRLLNGLAELVLSAVNGIRRSPIAGIRVYAIRKA